MRRFGVGIAALGFAAMAAVAVAASAPEPDVTAFQVAVALCEEHPGASICTQPTTTTSTTLPPSSTTATTTTTTLPTVLTEDFADPASFAARFEFGIDHRDDVVVHTLEWPGDHDLTCGPPEEKRTVHRDTDEWVYQCAPGGDPTAAHVMTSIGDTSGYSIGAFTPAQSFTDVSEVRWSVNITDLGPRQWTEVKVIPEANFAFDDLPCNNGLPCANSLPEDVGSVSTSFLNRKQWINVEGTLTKARPWNEAHPDDPATDSIRIRREHFFRDNGDGTVTFGIEEEAGTFAEFTSPGSFPTGPVRVVFADHVYTPEKDGPLDLFTWHWDDLRIE